MKRIRLTALPAFLFTSLLWFAASTALAAASLSPSNVVLNAYLSLQTELRGQADPNVASAVARSQSHYWDYEQTTQAAFPSEWQQIEKSGLKWEMVSAVGAYLHAALTTLMGSEHAVTGVTVINEKIEDQLAVVTTKIRVVSGDAPIQVYFRLRNTDQGWKIFDFSAPSAGFHLNINIRNNALPVLQKQGIEDAIAHLKRMTAS